MNLAEFIIKVESFNANIDIPLIRRGDLRQECIVEDDGRAEAHVADEERDVEIERLLRARADRQARVDGLVVEVPEKQF